MAEILISLEFFTSGPHAFSLGASILVSDSDALWKVLLPVVGSWWMTEVGSEEISSLDKLVIGSNNLSFIPFALSRALSFVRVNTFLYEGGVGVHESCSTEVVIWDHFSSGGEDAWCGACSHVKAGSPFSFWNILNLSS